jgi:hypothetical protein
MHRGQITSLPPLLLCRRPCSNSGRPSPLQFIDPDGSRNNDTELCSKGALFKFQVGSQVSGQKFCGFPESLQENNGIVPQTGS